MMPAVNWEVVAEIATTVSTVAFAASAIVVVIQLRQAARERYFSVTAHLFEIWQSPEFQHDQLFILHKLPSTSWDEFCAQGRGERAERAIHRVGGFYDRIGNLVRHGLIRKDDILPTVGGYAVAAWQRIQPLVKELRLRENALLFENYESLLPECRDCYVPGIGSGVATSSVVAFDATGDESGRTIDTAGDRRSAIPNGIATTQSNQTASQPAKRMDAVSSTVDAKTLATLAVTLPDTDGIAHNLSEFAATGPAVVVYARGAWCPYCLRQLADYAEWYAEFRQAGAEIVAVSPESPRRSRRLRTQLKLPFTVLSDSRFEAAKVLGLLSREKPGEPTPATLLLDPQRGVTMSTLNQREKSVVAGDMLDYVREARQSNVPAAIPVLSVTTPKPGILFERALVNLASGIFVR